MRTFARGVAFSCLLCALAPAQDVGVSLTSLLQELVDLDRLARLPEPAYRTVQYGSSDRRTSTPDHPGWFANADGFGREPEPGFAGVVRAPGQDGVGEYLICDVEGPGAIVRGWSAGMDGVLRVFVDGRDEPLFEGKGYDFFARRTAHLLPGAEDLADAGIRAALEPQQDADYLPIPFAERLRITWTGTVGQLHFYQLQVRRYAPGTKVRTFDPAEALRLPARGRDATPATTVELELPVDGVFAHEEKAAVPHACRELGFTVVADDLPRALRGVLLRVTCDGAGVPQVEAPLGDFFASAPGITPFTSLPIDVGPDGALVCRWVMPYRETFRVELQNHSGVPVRGTMRHRHAALREGFDDGTLYFHAHWRVDHELFARAGQAPIDLPYVTAIGQGRLVGLACQVVNPPMHPSWRSNWWGEGDERIAVDGVIDTFGTGSEDYYNYSWSHWRYFAHPYCGQPISSGPGNTGYVANHRFQIVDDLPFTQSLWATMELWSHRPVHPLSYGRIAYFYARPGVLTDHRALQPDELYVPALPPWTPMDFAPRGDALTWTPGALPGGFRAVGGEVEKEQPNAFVRSGSILSWRAPPGGRLELPFTVDTAGTFRLRLSCQQRPDAPAVRCEIDGQVLQKGGRELHDLACVHGQRFEDLVFDGVELAAGEHALALVCPDGGTVGLDLVGCEPMPPKPQRLPGASEAELWDVVDRSEGVEVEVQNLGAGWSSGHHRWVKATAAGQRVTFRVPAAGAGEKVVLRLTTSRDYGIVRVEWNGTEIARDVDLWGGPDRGVRVKELDLGARDLSQPVELRFTVTGHNEGSEPPHFYFGVDCLLVR